MDIREIYQEKTYDELTEILNDWLNPSDENTEGSEGVEESSTVTENVVSDESAAFDELFNK